MKNPDNKPVIMANQDLIEEIKRSGQSQRPIPEYKPKNSPNKKIEQKSKFNLNLVELASDDDFESSNSSQELSYSQPNSKSNEESLQQ